MPFGSNVFGSSESSEFSSYQDLGYNNISDGNGSMALATKDQSTIRFHDLMAGHLGSLQILVFTANLWEWQSFKATALSLLCH